MYKDRHGIYYKNFIDRLLGKASPSLNMMYGGMAALEQRAVNRMLKRAKIVDALVIHWLARGSGNTTHFMGYGEKKKRKYAIYVYHNTYLATEVKAHEKL